MPEYRMMFPAPRRATVGFTPAARMVIPAMPVPMPNVLAWGTVNAPRTRGRFRVRDIIASNSGSEIMLKVLALAMHNDVPVERKRRVGKEPG